MSPIHVFKKFDILKPEHTMRDFIGRGAAEQFKDKEKGYELFNPIILQNDKITYLFIQVKNQAQNLKYFKDNKFNERKLFIF